MALNHPSVEVDSAQVAETVLAGLRETLPAEQLDAVIERGKTLELDAVVAELLAERRSLNHSKCHQQHNRQSDQ